MIKHEWLITEAKRWVGVYETSENRGPVVDHFIKDTGGVLGNPWCVSFIRYCVENVDKDVDKIFTLDPDLRAIKNTVHKTHSAMSLWDNALKNSKESLTPQRGFIVVWQHYNKKGQATGLGHCGIVTSILDSERWFTSVEGNTSSRSNLDRDGDGVFEKTRSFQGTVGFRLLGYIDPWAQKLKT